MFKLFRKQSSSITAAALLVAVSSILSRLLGVIRDRILAGQFGASASMDVYYSAFRIPDLIFNLLILGALSAGFIPIFSSLVKEFRIGDRFHLRLQNKAAWDLANNVLNSLVVILIVVSGIGMIFAPVLMKLIAPGFSPELQAQAALLTRIMFLSPLLLAVSSILGGILQSFKSFFIYSLSPILYNIGIIIGAIYLYPIFGLAGLAWGVVLGAFLHMLIQIPAVMAFGYHYRPFLDWKDKAVREIGRLMIPRTLSLAISQINLVVITIIASGLSSGSLSVFNFANNLQSFPIGVFGVSFAVAAFPVFARLANDKKALLDSFSHVARQILLFIVPATILFITLRAQIVRVILGSGNFSWRDTVLTMDTLGFFAISLFAQALVPLQTRIFYARQNSKTPFVVGLITVAFNVLLSLKLGKSMGVSGLALAFSLSNILNFGLLWILMHIQMGFGDHAKIISAVAKFTLAGVIAGFFVQISKEIIWPFIDMTKFSGVFVQLIFATIIGTSAYFICCYVLRSEELLEFLRSIKNRLARRKLRGNEGQGEARGI